MSGRSIVLLELEQRLAELPKSASLAIASRVALRAFPYAFQSNGKLTANFDSSERHDILTVLRAASTAWLANLVPPESFANAIAFARESIQALYERERVTFEQGPMHTWPRVVNSTLQIADPTFKATTAAKLTSSAMQAANFLILGDSYNEFYEELSYDTSLLEKVAPSELATKPLWSSRVPPSCSDYLNKIQKSLLAHKDEDWEAWTDWYDARFRGGPANTAAEFARVTDVPEEHWSVGPNPTNSRILSILSKFTLPPRGALRASLAVGWWSQFY